MQSKDDVALSTDACIVCFLHFYTSVHLHSKCMLWVMTFWHGYMSGVRCKWFASWCHCHPILSYFIKMQICLSFLLPAYPPVVLEEAVKRVSLSHSHFVVICQNQLSFLLKQTLLLIKENHLVVCSVSFSSWPRPQVDNGVFEIMATLLSHQLKKNFWCCCPAVEL